MGIRVIKATVGPRNQNGDDTWIDIERFGKERLAWLRRCKGVGRSGVFVDTRERFGPPGRPGGGGGKLGRDRGGQLPGLRGRPGWNQDYGEAAVSEAKDTADLSWQLSQRAADGKDYETIYMVGHGILGATGTDFPGGGFRYPLQQDIIDSVHGILNETGTIVIDSCNDQTDSAAFALEYQAMADQLGYPVKVTPYMSLFDEKAGARSIEAPYLIFRPARPNPPIPLL